MRIKITGLQFSDWDKAKETIGKGNSVQMFKEENKYGTDGLAWKAVYAGNKFGYMPELDTPRGVRNWQNPCKDTIRSIELVREKKPDMFQMFVEEVGPNWIVLNSKRGC